MKEKANHIFCQILNSVILAGMIVFFIGVYYWMIKAGIPYQDPPLELQIQYTVNNAIGEILIAKGFWIAVCGGVFRLIFALVCRNRQKKSVS